MVVGMKVRLFYNFYFFAILTCNYGMYHSSKVNSDPKIDFSFFSKTRIGEFTGKNQDIPVGIRLPGGVVAVRRSRSSGAHIGKCLELGGYAIFKMRAPVRSGALYLRCVYKNRVCFAIRPVKMHVAVCTGSWETAHLHSHQEHTNSPPARLFTTRRPGLALNPTLQHLKPRGFPLNRPPCPPTPLTRIFKACYLSIVHFRSFF